MAETWLLNETITGELSSQTVNFVSSGSEFVGIVNIPVPHGFQLNYYVQQGSSTTDLTAYFTTNGWLDTTYRTITFAKPPTGDLFTWLQANGTKQTVPRKSYDLSTSAKWATLSSGNHNVQIVAKASGYRDSEKSAAVSVTKAAATVTLSKGTYKFVSQPTAVSSVIQQDIVCTAAADTYSYTLNQIQVNMSTASTRVQLVSTVDVMVNSKVSGSSNYAWYNYNDGNTNLLSTSPTITIASDVQVSAEFYKWAITDGNLVKQQSHTIAVEFSRGATGYFNLNGTDLASSETSLSLTEDSTVKLYVTLGDLSSANFSTVTVGGVDIPIPDNKTIDVYKQDVEIYVSFAYEHSPAELALTINYHASEKPSSETWLLNKTIDTNKSVNITSNISCTINLLIDNQGTYISKSGTTINVFGGSGGPYIIDVDSSGNRLVYYDALGGWNSQYDESYYKTNDTSKLRTIIFATPPTGDLLTWLQANGNKQ